MSRSNPESRVALARSHQDLADRITAGRGFHNGRVTVYDPVKCAEFKRDQQELANRYLRQSEEVKYG